MTEELNPSLWYRVPSLITLLKKLVALFISSTQTYSCLPDAMSSYPPTSKLYQLELQNADDGQLTDIRRSDALTTKLEEVKHGYFLSPQIIGSITAIALATLYVANYIESCNILLVAVGCSGASRSHKSNRILPGRAVLLTQTLIAFHVIL